MMYVVVVTPRKFVHAQIVDIVIVPSPDVRRIGILENHQNMSSALESGLIAVRSNGKWTPFVTYGIGFLAVERNLVSIASMEIEEFIDPNVMSFEIQLIEAIKKLEEAISTFHATTGPSFPNAVMELQVARARVEGLKLLLS